MPALAVANKSLRKKGREKTPAIAAFHLTVKDKVILRESVPPEENVPVTVSAYVPLGVPP